MQPLPELSAPDLERVYCAGPLFNQSERDEMTQIADLLCESGFRVYLPHRDGMEFRCILQELTDRGWPPETSAAFLHAAIFALDIYQLVAECGSIVWNLNGRTPDEGAVSESAIAWALGKPIVAYKDDVRSLIAGRDNPLLSGLVDFQIVRELEQIPVSLRHALGQIDSSTCPVSSLPQSVQRAVGQGSLLWGAMCASGAHGDNSGIADVVAELFAPKPSAV